MDADSPLAATASLRIDEVFPPYRLTPNAAAELARFVKPAAELEGEPRQKDAFVLVAVQLRALRAVVGYIKLQHGARRSCWIREMAVDPVHRRQGIGRALVRRAIELVVPREDLAIEVFEGDTPAHCFLRACGLTAEPPWIRTRRQRDARLYEFRSYRPPAISFGGLPRFTWPPGR